MTGSSRETSLENGSESLEPFLLSPQSGLFERMKFSKVNLCWQSQIQMSRLRSSLSPEHEKWTTQGPYYQSPECKLFSIRDFWFPFYTLPARLHALIQCQSLRHKFRGLRFPTHRGTALHSPFIYHFSHPSPSICDYSITAFKYQNFRQQVWLLRDPHVIKSTYS